jgi:hypothetical protein
LSPAGTYTVGGFPTSTPAAVVTGDFNGDTRPDLAVANSDSSTVSVLLGNGDGTFQQAQTSATGRYSELAVGDFDGDGKLDLVATNYNDVSVLLGKGDGTFKAPTNIGIGATAVSVAVGDFDDDGKLDLGVTSREEYTGYYGDAHYFTYANVLLGNGDGTFRSPTTSLVGNWAYTSAAVADFNGDHNLDFALASYGGDTVDVVLGSGTGTFGPAVSFSVGNNQFPAAVAVGDVNADGKLDLVTGNAGGYGVSVLLGDGQGAFVVGHSYFTGAWPSFLGLGDFTNDGRLDIVTPSNGVGVLLGTGGGSFSTPISSPTGSVPVALAEGDFNGDGWLDVATANLNTDNISVMINDRSWTPGVPAVSIGDVTLTEGNTGTRAATFTVTLSVASTQPVTIAYATSNGTASAGTDYQAASGTLIIPAGQTTGTITVLVNGDRIGEPNETFFVNLSSPSNATVADGQGVATIVDDEPRISISDVSEKEGSGKKTTRFVFTVTLSVAYDQPVTLSFQTVNGTATTGDNDYVARAGTITFIPGETTKTIIIDVKGDSRRESNEYFYLDLSGNSGSSVLDKKRGIGTILNDD